MRSADSPKDGEPADGDEGSALDPPAFLKNCWTKKLLLIWLFAKLKLPQFSCGSPL
jgi:hypothetical protein